jgi:hypothetical protein
MASIPTRSGAHPEVMYTRVAEQAQRLFTRALKEETGLDFRSSGAALLARDGAIHVQVLAANGPQAHAASGMVLQVHPTNREWAASQEVPGAGIQYRDYDMGLAQSLSPAQIAAGMGGRIVGASQISLRFGLRLGQGRCSHAPPQGHNGVWSGPGRLAQVIVFGDTAPRTHLMRAWTSMHP